MLLDEIEKIDLIESSNVEMKARLNRDDSQEWLKTVAGFANARGGVLYIGVEDKSNKLIGFDREYLPTVRYTMSQKDRFNCFVHPIKVRHLSSYC